jgi:hypothetical protein
LRFLPTVGYLVILNQFSFIVEFFNFFFKKPNIWLGNRKSVSLLSVEFDGGGSSSGQLSTPKKALLMRVETNMLMMSPLKEGKPNANGLQQLDIETGKILTQWKFEKDGTDITMSDIMNDTKGSQLDPSELTFLGLDDNRLC